MPRLNTDKTVVVDMDPAVDPILLWSGKRNRREVPVLPLQRNEIVSESRIAQIIARARRNVKNQTERQGTFADLEREFRSAERERRVEFYTHDEEWRNKLICGDSLEVMESLIKYEGLSGAVQMVYIDPPYGVGYDANFQQRVDVAGNSAADTADDVLTVRAFRDTWSLGIHSYLEYLRERLYLARELLATAGSVFVQMSEDNVHLVRTMLDEVFGRSNFCGQIAFVKTAGLSSDFLPSANDYLLWYAKDRSSAKFHQLYNTKVVGGAGASQYTWIESPDGKTRRQMSRDELSDPAGVPKGWRIFSHQSAYTTGSATTTDFEFEFEGRTFKLPPRQRWRTTRSGMERLVAHNRLFVIGNSLRYKRYLDDFPGVPLNQSWTDTSVSGFSGGKWFVVQTNEKVVARCILMTTDPGDLVFDPTCGSGTSAVAAERWGRRWITCDVSRVAVNVARQRLLSSIFEAWVLPEGRVSGGFRYEAIQRLTLRSLTNDQEPERVELTDRPERDGDALRICGPIEVMSLGQYSIEDWRGDLINGAGADAERLGNYVEVICRLYRRDAEVVGGTRFLHAVAEAEDAQIGISVGPLTGRVTAKQVLEAAHEASDQGLREVHVLGWAFEANVGEIIEEVEASTGVRVVLEMIRPDALAAGLKVTKSAELFSPLALPEVRVDRAANGMFAVILEGVGLFSRKTRSTEWHSADDGYIAAWYLDEDYDGDCFVDCQMFFDFRKTPNLTAVAGVEIDAGAFELVFQSEPFSPGEYRRVAVKVVDVYGNESTLVRGLEP